MRRQRVARYAPTVHCRHESVIGPSWAPARVDQLTLSVRDGAILLNRLHRNATTLHESRLQRCVRCSYSAHRPRRKAGGLREWLPPLLSGAEASRDGLSTVASRFSAVFTSAFMTGYDGRIGALHTVEIGGDTAPGVLGAGLQHSGSLPVLPPQSVCR